MLRPNRFVSLAANAIERSTSQWCCFLTPLFARCGHVCRWFYRRFPSHERFVGLVATGLASIAVTVLGIQCFRLFAAVWEVVRVGNGHMTSIRAASYSRWSQQYVGADFIGGLLLFWLIAVICYRSVSNDEHFTDVREPRGILLH